MKVLAYALRLARIAALLALIWLAGTFVVEWNNAISLFPSQVVPAPHFTWLKLTGAAMGFMAVALVARGPGQALWLLIVEAVVAGYVGILAPSMEVWFAFRDLPDYAPANALVEFFRLSPLWLGQNLLLPAALGIAWLGVSVESVVRQVRHTTFRVRSQQTVPKA